MKKPVLWGLAAAFVVAAPFASARVSKNVGVAYDHHGYSAAAYEPLPVAKPVVQRKVVAKRNSVTTMLGVSYGPAPQAKGKRVRTTKVVHNNRKHSTSDVHTSSLSGGFNLDIGTFAKNQIIDMGVGMIPFPAGAAGDAAFTIMTTTVRLMWAAGEVVIKEDRELGHGEACEQLPFVGMLGGCDWLYKIDLCERPDLISYRPHWNDGTDPKQLRTKYFKKYCNDPAGQRAYAKWQKANPNFQELGGSHY